MQKAFKAALCALPVCLAMALFLISPARYIGSVRQGISLWAVNVLPAVFPFLFLTSVLTETRAFAGFSRRLSPAAKLFRVSGAGGSVAILAAVSGYPVGARMTAGLKLPRGELFRTAALSSTSGPVFLVGTVGSAMFGRPAYGWLLLLCHFLAVWTVCFFLRIGAPKPSSLPLPRGERGDMTSAVLSVLCVGGSIALFSAFGQMLSDLLPLGETGGTVLRGLVEMTTGCGLAAGYAPSLALPLCAFFVTFGGACVLFQQLLFLAPAGVKPLPFLAVKFVQGMLAGALCLGLCYALGL